MEQVNGDEHKHNQYVKYTLVQLPKMGTYFSSVLM